MAEASTSNPDKFVLPSKLLTLDNYGSWKILMRISLKWHDLWSYLESRDVNRGVELRRDKDALDAIKKSCTVELLPHIMYADTAKEAWDWLAETGTWTDMEKEHYKEMLATAATAREKSDNVPEVDKILTRRNYQKWKKYIQNVLVSKFLWTVVDGSESFNKTRNHNASVIIRMSCGEEMFNYIDDDDNAKDAWCSLKKELGETTSNIDSNEIIIDYELLQVTLEDEVMYATSVNSSVNVNHRAWYQWEDHTEKYLISHGLWGFLEEPELSDCVKDEKALDAIKASCGPEMRAYIMYMDCAKNAWEKLERVATGFFFEYEASIHREHREMVNEAARSRPILLGRSEADKVLTRSNYQMWEEYVTMLLRSRFLYDVVLQIDPKSILRGLATNENEKASAVRIIKEACALRIIKEACGREMLPYIFRTTSPEEAMIRLRKACSMDQKDEYMKYSRLLHAVQKNRFSEEIRDPNGELWRGAHKFFRDFPEALTAEITEDGSTALHVAVRLGRVDFVRELLDLMSAEQLEIKTCHGNTVIAVAAGGNNMEIVKMLVNKNPELLLIRNEHGLHAVTIAAINGAEKIMRYLYPFTPKSKETWGAMSVASLLTSAARLDAFDIVRDLLSHFPDYALVRDNNGMSTLLSVLAEKPSAFPSGNQFGFLERWIYLSAKSKMLGIVVKALKKIVPGVKQVFERKEKHDHTAVILQQICSLLPNLNPHQLKESFINDAIHRSIIHGTVEVFEILIDTNPYLEHFKDEKGRGLFQIAIINRQESIFQYMSQMGQRNQDMALLDSNDNNALHCAAFLDPLSQLVHGPALQMQLEIQWFQEVERVVPPRYKEMKNKHNLTPRALFSREHKDLVKDAEKWMKEMANACIIVTALIATVMFAAPFTLPGGSDQNTGVSLTLQSRAFKVFIVSDVISLFASCTSLLMFFSILTARYAERDFLTSLPRRLILGLFTLFFSMATMMVTFTATIIIVLRAEARSRGFIWVSILACIPVLIFALLQFRLFGNLVISTYGRGVFRSKRVVVAPLISIGYG